MATTTNAAQQHAENLQTTDAGNRIAVADHQFENAVMIDGKEVEVKISNTHESPARRKPKVTFRIQTIIPGSRPGPIYYAKTFLPKTYTEAKSTVIKCFGGLEDMIHPRYSSKEAGTIRDFTLKVWIRIMNGDWAWATIMDNEWWELMNDLIEENPDLEVAVVPFKD